MKPPDPLIKRVGSLSPKRLFDCLLFLMLALGCISAHGQTPTPTPAPLPLTAQTPAPPTPAIIVSRKAEPSQKQALPGLPSGSDKAVYWTLRDAITMALENNVDIAIQRKVLRISEFNIRSAEGVYDLIFTGSPSFTSTTNPNIGRFSGLSTSVDSTSSQTLSLDAGLEKQLRFAGGNFQAGFRNPRTTSNSAIVSPLYSPQLSFSYTQPLWRNRSIDNNRLQIYIAKTNLTITNSQFRQQVINIIFEVQQAYWNLAFAIRNVSVQSDGVDLAQKQVDDNQKQVDVGILAPIDVITARAALETRRQAYIQAQNAATQAQNTLKNLVADGTQADIWEKQIFPTDFFEMPPTTAGLTAALADAFNFRPEVDQFQTQKEIDKKSTDYFRNQTKPQIDLVSSYSITGAGGTPTSTLTCPAGTGLDSSTSLCVPGNIQPTLTTVNINPKFIGSYPTAIGNMLTNKYNTVTVGLSISLPLHNTTAKANLGKALETEGETAQQERKQMQAIEVDVRNAYEAVLNAKKNLDATRLARQYSETQLDGEQKKFASGLSMTFLVLTRQNDLIQARGAEVSALAAYNNAVSALQQATGTTLTVNNVEIK